MFCFLAHFWERACFEERTGFDARNSFTRDYATINEAASSGWGLDENCQRGVSERFESQFWYSS